MAVTVLADAVPSIRRPAGDPCRRWQRSVPVLLDSGIRTGADIVKALAYRCGRRLLVGRPFLFALAAGGENVVATVLDHLLWDLRATLANLGYAAVCDVDAGCVAPSCLTREAMGPSPRGRC